MTAPPFPRRKRIERAAVLGLAIGTLSMTATFGLRTAVTQPDYEPLPRQLAALGLQGAAELAVTLAVGFLVLWPKTRGAAKAWLVALAVVIALAKGIFLSAVFMITEPNPWAVSPGTLALCALVDIPIVLSFFPVLTAIFAARPSPHPPESGLPAGTLPDIPAALDRPLEVRAALCVWLATIGLGTVALGPDLTVRLWGLTALSGAALHFVLGRAEERRLAAWVEEALTVGPPAYFILDDPPKAVVPTAYDGEPRKATIAAASEEAGSYRKEPSKKPVAAVDPAAAGKPRSFRARVSRRLGVPLVYTACLIAMSWPLLHSSDMPPHAITLVFDHEKVSPYSGTVQIPGVSLWVVDTGPNTGRIVGFDSTTREMVIEEALFRRLPPMKIGPLAQMANAIFHEGQCCVLGGADPGWPKDQDGGQPRPPFVQGNKLVYWRAWDGKSTRFEVPIHEGQIGPETGD